MSFAETIRQFAPPDSEARAYVETHLGRFLQTLELIPPGASEDAILEMGAYLQITPLLPKLGYGEVRGCYLGPRGRVDRKRVISSRGETFECEVDHFNAESDVFPYEDGRFATVVCCELIEHLSEDPMHLMAEANRILQPDGRLVLSTPNICSLRSIAAVLSGYHPALYQQYTIRKGGNAVEPRHAREYAPREIALLLEASGFEVEKLETGPIGLERPEQPEWTRQLLEQYAEERELPLDLRDDVIHARGRKLGPVEERYPSWLYL